MQFRFNTELTVRNCCIHQNIKYKFETVLLWMRVWLVRTIGCATLSRCFSCAHGWTCDTRNCTSCFCLHSPWSGDSMAEAAKHCSDVHSIWSCSFRHLSIHMQCHFNDPCTGNAAVCFGNYFFNCFYQLIDFSAGTMSWFIMRAQILVSDWESMFLVMRLLLHLRSRWRLLMTPSTQRPMRGTQLK